MGRKTKLTPDVAQAIVTAIQAGNYQDTAAAHAGVHPATFYRWMERGAADSKAPYREFREAVEKALAFAEVRDVALIAKAAETYWQAAAWRLERKFPDRWGRKERQEVTGASGGPVQHVVRVVRE